MLTIIITTEVILVYILMDIVLLIECNYLFFVKNFIK